MLSKTRRSSAWDHYSRDVTTRHHQHVCARCVEWTAHYHNILVSHFRETRGIQRGQHVLGDLKSYVRNTASVFGLGTPDSGTTSGQQQKGRLPLLTP